MVSNPLKIEGPRHPTAKEYPAFLKFLSQAYRFADSRWFENDAAFFFGTRPDQLKTKWVLKSGEKFIAHVGIFPFTATMEGPALKVAGIGAVATHPDFRGQGLMKRLMDQIMGEVKRDGYDLSILWGERGLYQPYGYERALYLDQFTFQKRHLKYFATPKGVRPVRPADLPALQVLFKDHPFRVKRSTNYTSSVIRRFSQYLSDPAWVLEEKGKVAAYAIFGKSWAGGLEAVEWGGQTEDVACLFSTVLQHRPEDSLMASLYSDSGLYGWALENCSDHVRTTRSCMLKLLKLDSVLRAFEPQLQESYGKLGRNAQKTFTLRMEDGQTSSLRLGGNLRIVPPSPEGIPVTLSHSDCVRLLFGIGRPSEALRRRPGEMGLLDSFFPLRWYWWKSDWI
jgi:GNAT superfamily N-acetyltransferase